MTSKEAKKILNEYRNRNYNSTVRDELELAKAIDTILPKYVDLEARDTPIKTTNAANTKFIFWCRKCDCSSIQRYDNFCHKCGQKLDWEEE